MEKDIKKLLSKETPLTGEETGRLMILDLLAAYKNLQDGGDGSGVLSNAQKIEIVDRLTSSDDISRFNDFRGIHDYLTSVSAVCDSFVKTYEIYYWRLYYLLSTMEHVEEENAFLMSMPVIMTKPQYKRFMLSGEPYPSGGIAVLQYNPDEACACEKDEFDCGSIPEWRKRCSAENIILSHSDHITESVCGMKDALAECLARIKALELIGRYIKVSKVKILAPPIDEIKIKVLNNFITIAIDKLNRKVSHGEQYEQELKQKLSELFTPIDLKALEPDPLVVKKARRSLNFSLIKNGSEAFVAMIKKEWRNDNAQ